tara:strand:- start:1030 stop:1470 length:441 start_codon:yes stop_codon:yes gene_type:complete
MSSSSEKTKAAKPQFLGRDAIFLKGRAGLAPRSVYVDEWEGEVRYRPMSMELRRQVRTRCQTVEMDPTTGDQTKTLDPEMFEVYALIHCCLDPEDDNKLLFNKDHAETLEKEVSAGPISTVSTAILKDSGLAPDAIKRGHSGTQGE